MNGQEPAMTMAEGTVVGGKYRILGLIGKGGMGVVYKAHDAKLQRDVALKFLAAESARDPQAVERFQREARSASALNHPHICTIYDIDEHEGRHFIALELLEGRTLQELARGPRLEAARVVDWAIQAASGLEAAHAKGIIHRDIKSANIFVTDAGRVKILDFGLAKLLPGQPHKPEVGQTLTAENDLTTLGSTVGTQAYMSPEQALGRELDGGTDVFSLGVVLYEIATGTLPFRGETAAALFDGILNRNPTPPSRLNPDLPPDLDRIIAKALEKDRAARYRSAQELRADLLRLQRGEALLPAAAPSGRRGEAPRASARPGPRRLLLFTAIGTALVLLAAAVFFVAKRGGKATPPAADSVVVLPCRVLGGQDTEFLTEAIPDSLSSLLAGVEGLDTRVPITAAEFERVKSDLGKIAVLYKVKRFVRPSVSIEADQMTLRIDLVDSATRTILKSTERRGRRSGYLELVQGTAEEIRRMLRPDSKPVASPPGPAADSEVELLLRQARFYSNRFHDGFKIEDHDRSLSILRRVLEIDPQRTEAAAGMAWLSVYKAWHVAPDPKTLDEAVSWARRAIAGDPLCGRAWSALSGVEMLSPRPDRTKQLAYALKAVRLAPRERESYTMLGNAPLPGLLGLEASVESYRLDSLDLSNGTSIAFTLFCYGRSREGLPYVDACLSADPEFPFGAGVKFLILADSGRLDEAAGWLQKILKNDQESLPPRLIMALGRGDAAEADRLLKEILLMIGDPQAQPLMIDSTVMILLSFLVRHGRMEAALEILERDLEAGAGGPFYDMLMLDSRLEPLRREARFRPLLERYRRACLDLIKTIAQVKARGELPGFLEAPLSDWLKKLAIQP